ncbi:MAG: hypothetical protein ACREKE_01895 [bacterium]
MKVFAAIEDLLAYLPRTVLLVLAVFVMRNPFAEGSLHRFGWYVRLPLEFVLLLFLALALAAALRLIRDHAVHNKRVKPLA